MNTITTIFIIIWSIAFIIIASNATVLMSRWARIKKGKIQKQSFIKKHNRMILWISLIVAYLAVILFCIFYDADIMTKAKIFAIIIMIMPFQPIGIILIVEYCFLYNQDRIYSKNEYIEHISNDTSRN